MSNADKEKRKEKLLLKRFSKLYTVTSELTFPWLQWLVKNEKGPAFAKCTFCNCEIEITRGRQDIVNHSESKTHGVNTAVHGRALYMEKAETMIATFMRTAKFPPEAAECFPKLIQSILTDSSIAQNLNLDNIRANFRGESQQE